MERYFLVFIFHFYVSNLNFVAYDPPVLYNESDFLKIWTKGKTWSGYKDLAGESIIVAKSKTSIM